MGGGKRVRRKEGKEKAEEGVLGAQEGKGAQGSQFQETCALSITSIKPLFGFQACHTQGVPESISCLILHREKKA